MKMKLYQAAVSKPSAVVVWFIQRHNIPDVELVPINLLKADHLKPEYFAKNIYQTVPMLELEDGTTLTESNAILLYLTRRFNVENEIPRDPMGEAQTISAMLHHDSLCRKGSVLGRKILAKARNPKLTWDQVRESITPDREELQGVLETVDAVLGKTKYIAGNQWTLADYTVASELFQWSTIPDDLLPESIRVSRFGNVGKYLELAKQQPGFDEHTRHFSYLAKMIDAAAEQQS